jgi:acetylornithine deacetylase
MATATESTVKTRVIETITSMESEIARSLSEFVQIPSVNPKYPGVSYEDVVGGETAANHYVATLYEQAGCRIEWVEAEARRANLVGVLGGGGRGHGRSLIFNGHVDVVPPGDNKNWSDGNPFSGRIENGRVYGRGACDQKGGVIAQTMAAVALKRAGVHLEGDLILESVVGEEVMDHVAGVDAVTGAGFRADAAIVSEPTAPPVPLAVVPITPGLLWLGLTVTGKAVHASVRDELIRAGGRGSAVGVNAIEKAVYLLGMIQRLEETWGQSRSHPLFKPGHFTLHPGVIVGGPHGALVPFLTSEFCTIEYAIWYPPQNDVEEIKQEVEDFVLDAARLDPWLRANPPAFDWKLHWEPSILDQQHPICQLMARVHAEASGEAPAITQDAGRFQGFCAVCDATFLNKAGIPAVVYGPGSLTVGHAANEYVDLAEVLTATRAYALAAMEWCGLREPAT